MDSKTKPAQWRSLLRLADGSPFSVAEPSLARSAAGQPGVPWPLDGRVRGPIRIRTLTTLRWLAVIGQTLAILIVHFGLGFELSLGLCLATIAASAWLNLFVILQFSPQRFLTEEASAFFIGFDILQLCVLLFLTGGLQNPFAIVVLAPVTIAAGVLPMRQTTGLCVMTLVALAIIAVFHFPLPWNQPGGVQIPRVYLIGVWAALSFSVIFFSSYAYRIAKESAQMRNALTATQMVIAREERLSAIGGLAAAAAHELGTPLATIQVTAQEMSETIADLQPGEDSADDHQILMEDAALLIGQARRCRDILGRLSERGDAGDLMHDRIRLDSLLREAAGPFLNQNDAVDIDFHVDCQGNETPIPSIPRRPEMIYGLRNFIENAVAYARSRVYCEARWDEDGLVVSITDDGPGFSPEALARLGEPYVNRNRGVNPNRDRRRNGGMGLGFFIAKTLLERTGATIYFNNEMGRDGRSEGAFVSASWPISAVSFGVEHAESEPA